MFTSVDYVINLWLIKYRNIIYLNTTRVSVIHMYIYFYIYLPILGIKDQ